MGIKSYGFDGYEKEVKNIIEKFPSEVTDELEMIGDALVTRIKFNTPVLHGDLKRSIDKDKVKNKGIEYELEVGTNKEYAEPVEYGFIHNITKRFIKGQHFFEKSVTEFQDIIGIEIERWFRRMMARLKL